MATRESSTQEGMGILEDDIFLARATSMADARQSPRFALTVPVRYTVEEPVRAPTNATVDNVSLGGVRLSLSAAENVSQNTRVSLEIHSPDRRRTVEVEGVVVWLSPVSDGVAQGIRPANRVRRAGGRAGVISRGRRG